MFIAMNRFRVQAGQGEAFERIWRERDSYLADVPGFVQFALLRGEEGEYVSHSTWESRGAFEAWIESDAFRRSHAQGSLAGILAGPPVIGMYDALMVQPAIAPA